MTETLLAVIVLTRLLRRFGAWSIHRPILDERQIMATVVKMPLQPGQCLIHIIIGISIYRTALAAKVSGYADAVKMI